jgi:hypothetical protein
LIIAGTEPGFLTIVMLTGGHGATRAGQADRRRDCTVHPHGAVGALDVGRSRREASSAACSRGVA